MEPRGGEPSSLRHRAENHPVLEQLRGGGWGKPLGGVYQGRTAVLWLILKNLSLKKLEKVIELLKLIRSEPGALGLPGDARCGVSWSDWQSGRHASR